jgi:hypothetical protein
MTSSLQTIFKQIDVNNIPRRQANTNTQELQQTSRFQGDILKKSNKDSPYHRREEQKFENFDGKKEI